MTLFFLERAARRDPGLDGEISLTLLDDAAMRSLNRRFSGRDETTDVLSFRFTDQPGMTGVALGECVINAERALRVGARYGGTARELALYIAHACDHLSGANDTTEPQRRRMRQRELRWLREAAAQGAFTEDIIKP